MNETTPTRRPGRPRREESGEIERQLVDAAMRMMVQHGPGVTMNMIIAASGLSRKTVYAHYPNKPALMAAVVHQMLDYGLEPMALTEQPDWRDSLLGFVRQCLHEVCQPQAMSLCRLLMLDPGFMNEVKPRIEQVVMRRYMDPLTAFLEQLVSAEEIPPQDITFAAESLTNLVLAESQRRFFQNDFDIAAEPERIAMLARKTTRLFCGGILAGAQ